MASTNLLYTNVDDGRSRMVPLAGGGAMTVVPIEMVQQGHVYRFEDSYSLALKSRLSRADYNEILGELNRVCVKYAPNMGWRYCMLIPLFGCFVMCAVTSQIGKLDRELQRACNDLAARFEHRGINLRMRRVTNIQSDHWVVDIELLPEDTSQPAMGMAVPYQKF